MVRIVAAERDIMTCIELNIIEGLQRSKSFVVIMLLTFGCQILIVTFGGDFVQTVPLSIYNWLACAGIAAFGLIVGMCL